MTDHQTLEWLLTKLRNAENLNDYYAKRVAELEAKPAVEAPAEWRGMGRRADEDLDHPIRHELPPDNQRVLVRMRVTSRHSPAPETGYTIALMSVGCLMPVMVDGTVGLSALNPAHVTGWMPIPGEEV